MPYIYTLNDNRNLTEKKRKKKAKKRLNTLLTIIDRGNKKEKETIEFKYF